MEVKIMTGAVRTKKGNRYQFKIYDDNYIELWKEVTVRAAGGYAIKERPVKLTNEVKEMIKADYNIDVWQF